MCKGKRVTHVSISSPHKNELIDRIVFQEAPEVIKAQSWQRTQVPARQLPGPGPSLEILN